jgi:hypothetical protein
MSAMLFGFAAARGCFICCFRWHPLFGGVFVFSLASAMRLAAQALPLCGAAPPFLCCCKEKGGKESSFKPWCLSG